MRRCRSRRPLSEVRRYLLLPQEYTIQDGVRCSTDRTGTSVWYIVLKVGKRFTVVERSAILSHWLPVVSHPEVPVKRTNTRTEWILNKIIRAFGIFSPIFLVLSFLPRDPVTCDRKNRGKLLLGNVEGFAYRSSVLSRGG